MTSEIYFQEQVISEFTLALLEDSGWYTVNYYTGGLMKFGMHKGCKFLYNDCIVDRNNHILTNDFCITHADSDVTEGTCSIGRLSRGYCGNLFSPYDEYKRFRYTFLGRKNVEFCPVSNQYKENDLAVFNYNGNCNLGNNDFGDKIYFMDNENHKYTVFSDTIGQKYVNNSLCFK